MPAAGLVQALRTGAAVAVPGDASSVRWALVLGPAGFQRGEKKQLHLKIQINKDNFSSSCEGQVLQYSFSFVARPGL